MTNSGNGSITYSTDGVTLSSSVMLSSNVASVAFGDGVFASLPSSIDYNVAVWNGTSARTLINYGANVRWTKIIHGGGRFVGIGSTPGKQIITSEDGVTWTLQTTPYDFGWSRFAYGNGRYVATGYYNTDRVYGSLVSTDGQNWQKNNLNFGFNGSYSLTSLEYLNNKFIMTAYLNSVTPVSVYSSVDGINWTLESNAAPSQQWNAITYGAGRYIAVGTGVVATRIMYSDDGSNWTGVSSANDVNGWVDVEYGNPNGNDVFVAVSNTGTSSKAIYSLNKGLSWQSINGGDTLKAWQSVVYGNGKFVAVGGSTGGTKRAMYSSDGINWTTVDSVDNTKAWSKVEYVGGRFVALCSTSNIIMTSLDGIVWTLSPNQFTGSFYPMGIDGDNGLIVGVGFYGDGNRIQTATCQQ
jgi:hypothetical protein